MKTNKAVLTLVEDGKTTYRICIAEPTEPVCDMLETAWAIQRLITEMTGVTLEIVQATKENETPDEILIGQTCRENEDFVIDREGMDSDDYDITFHAHKIALNAASVQGLWDCVAAFARIYLHYDPETMTEVKKVKTLSVKLPAFIEKGNGDLPYDRMLADAVRANAGVSEGAVCFSSPDVYARLLSYARSEAPARHKIRLIANSGIAPCDCPACRKAADEEGTAHGAYFRLVSKIAAELLPIWPEQRIQIAAYQETLTPPALTFPENVDVLVCAPKLYASCAVNEGENRTFAKNLKAWCTKARVQVLDFTSDYYFYPAPYPNYYTVQRNLHYYASLGISGCYLQWNTAAAGLEFGPVRKKLYRALLADPAMSAETYSALIDKTLEAVYGYRCVEPMRAYMNLMVKASAPFHPVTRPAQIVPVRKTTGHDGVSYDLTVMKEAYRLWDIIHPYRECPARSKVYLSQMIFNRYQALPESHAFVQFSEWFTDAIDNFDKTDVMNELFPQ